MTDRSMFRSLRHRNYRLFFGGQFISLTGTWMQMVAQSWLIYRLTHSAALLGLTGFIGQIPGFLIAPLGGVVADRQNRRTILIITQTSAMILAFILAALTLSGVVQVWQILALAALMGVVNAFDMPTRQAFVVEMVGKEDMVNAIGLNSSLFNGARIAGPAIAGALVSLVGEGWCFFANGVSYIAVLTGLLMMKVSPWARPQKLDSPLEHVIEGFSFVIQNRPIRSILLLLAIVSLAGMPYTTLMPIIADQILHSGSRGLGILMGLSGIGALLGALTITLKREIHGLDHWISISSLGFGLSLIAFSLSKVLWLSGLLLIPVGFCMMLQMASSNTLIQAMVPDRLRGRVMAVYSMMFLGMAPFGSLLSGIFAKPLGAPMTVGLGGLACALASVLFRRNLPRIREEGQELLAASG